MWVHSPEKEGRDAGELADIDPIGVAATNDVDAILGAGVDCVVYAAQGPEQDAGVGPRLRRAPLRRASTCRPPARGRCSTPPPTSPPGGPSSRPRRPTAVRRSTPPASNPASPPTSSDPAHDDVEHDHVDPGVGDRHVRHLPGEVHDEGGHGLREVRSTTHDALLGLPGSILSAWAPGINLIAYALGVELDEHPRAVRPRPSPTARSKSRAAPSRPARSARSARRPSAWSTVATRSSSST